MPRLLDRHGLAWDVVLGRAAWGTWVALFVPDAHDAPVRQADLAAGAWDAAFDEIDSLGPDDLLALFDRSRVKDE